MIHGETSNGSRTFKEPTGKRKKNGEGKIQLQPNTEIG
jgi:hypothetical protein